MYVQVNITHFDYLYIYFLFYQWPYFSILGLWVLLTHADLVYSFYWSLASVPATTVPFFFFPHPFLYLCISDTQVIVAFWSTHWLNANLIFIVFILKHNLSQGNRTFFLNCLPATRAKELIAGVWEPGEEGLLRTNHGTGRKDGRVWAPHTRGHVLSPTGRVFQKHRLHPELSAFLPNRAYWRGVN